MTDRVLYVCVNDRFGMGASCASGGSKALIDELRIAIYERELEWTVSESRCMGECQKGPNIKAAAGRLLQHCRPTDAGRLVKALEQSWEGGSLDARTLNPNG